jgi:hypothetical protein
MRAQDKHDCQIKVLQQFLGEAYDTCVEADAKDREERAEAKQKKTETGRFTVVPTRCTTGC